MGKTRVGKLMQLFGASIDAMARAQDTGQDPFAALDEDVGWAILLGKRDEIAGFGELATSDPLSLAATCATETPATRACVQIDTFSSSDQTRFF